MQDLPQNAAPGSGDLTGAEDARTAARNAATSLEQLVRSVGASRQTLEQRRARRRGDAGARPAVDGRVRSPQGQMSDPASRGTWSPLQKQQDSARIATDVDRDRRAGSSAARDDDDGNQDSLRNDVLDNAAIVSAQAGDLRREIRDVDSTGEVSELSDDFADATAVQAVARSAAADARAGVRVAPAARVVTRLRRRIQVERREVRDESDAVVAQRRDDLAVHTAAQYEQPDQGISG